MAGSRLRVCLLVSGVLGLGALCGPVGVAMGSRLCCFKLALNYAGAYRVGYVPNTTPSAVAGGIEGPSGLYQYHLEGTAEGLGDMYREVKNFEATIAGIAAGWHWEASSVVEAPGSTPYCTTVERPNPDLDKYVRATSRMPSFSWGLAPAVAGFAFGFPFSNGPQCVTWDSWQGFGENYPDPFRFVYSQLGGGLYTVKASAFKSFDKLLHGPGSASLTCTESFNATTIKNPEMGGYTRRTQAPEAGAHATARQGGSRRPRRLRGAELERGAAGRS